MEVNLRYSTIYAPLSGTIGISAVKQGASVSPGATILNTISSDNPIAVDVAVDETLIPFMSKKNKENLQLAENIDKSKDNEKKGNRLKAFTIVRFRT
jgi:multidrug efflux pump subunit AcrA (membrane-fusion protein)